jgi:uncharacterized membrane protein
MDKKRVEKKEHPAEILIPAGVLIGLGLGFLFSRIVEGILIGLGTGFLLLAIIKLLEK